MLAGAISSSDGSISGNAIADMLLGYPRQSQLTPDTANFRTHQRGRSPSAFFNDDWKVTPNLTINAGMRWEFTTAMGGRRRRDFLIRLCYRENHRSRYE